MLRVLEEKNDAKQKKYKNKVFQVPYSLGKIKKNITLFSNNLSEQSKEVIAKQALRFHSNGNISEAVKLYQYLINQGFNDHQIFSNYGVILLNLGKFKEAKIALLKAIELKPDYAEAYSNLGNLLRNLGNFKEAEISINKAIDLKPDYAEAHSNLGNVLKELGKLKEAEKVLRKAIKLKPDYSNAYSNLGIVLKSLGYSDEAENNFSKAIDLNPSSTIALMNRWEFYFDKKDFDLALKDADSCISEDSKVAALKSLYALGRLDEIYERIKNISKKDDKNISLAAFSSFISEQEKKDTSYNFCRNPLDYMHFTNIKIHINNYIDFIREIINELYECDSVWEPLKTTTHNGFQTPTHIDLFSSNSNKISKLKSIILEELNTYYCKYEKETCSYIKKWPTIKNIFGWHVILKRQGYQEAHIHPYGWLSGVIYLKVVPDLDNAEGAIEFSLNGPDYSNNNSPKLTYSPKSGDIIFFPSSLHHRTIPFSTDTDRIVIAFDLMPQGNK